MPLAHCRVRKAAHNKACAAFNQKETMQTKLTKSVHHYLDGARGQYIPRDFARDTKRECISEVKAEDLDYLARGPGGCLDDDQSLAEGETVRG